MRAGAVPLPLQGLLAGLAAAVLTALVWAAGWLDPWEARTWDMRASMLAAPGAATEDIVVILLDQQSLDWASRENGWTWPWPREIYGAIVNYCRRAGARALAFDVLYTEPSTYGVADDAALGDAVAAFGRFAGTVFLGRTTGGHSAWPNDTPRPDIRLTGLADPAAAAMARSVTFPRATLPIAALARTSAVLGNVHMAPDPDGVYRRIQPLGIFDGAVLPSMGLGIYMAAHPTGTIHLSPGQMTIGDRHIPLDAEGRAILRYRGPAGTHRTFSAASVIQSEIRAMNGETPPNDPAAAFRDKFVFFGFSAPGLYDLRSAPVGGVYPGVEIHATTLDNFLSGDFMRRAPVWLSLGLLFILASACGVFASVFRRPAGSIGTAVVFLAAPVAASTAAYDGGLWVPLVGLELAVVLAFTLTAVANYATEGRQKRFIKNAFRQYLSPAVIDQLIHNPERLKLGGERRELSIFFSDLQGFTAISEGLAPEALTVLLNDYLTAMTDIIHDEGGTVDKYEGDAIIAFWNAPLPVPDHAVRIVRAALRCQDKLAELRPAFRERTGKDLFMRIGINTGPAVVGNMGSHSRFDYTMMGDAVNLAARLEGANKQFGTYTMISESTREQIGDGFRVRELARVAVVGRKKPVTVYEPMFPETFEANRAALETFDRGLRLFYAGRWDAAVDELSAIRETDPAAAAYAQKCMAMKENAPESWQGVWVMTAK